MPASIAEERAAVIAEAITWLGTRYIARARIKGGGVDCAMSLASWYATDGILPAFEPPPYAVQWGQNQSEETYLAEILKHATEIKEEDAQPADLVAYRMGRTFCHAALIIRWPGLVIHATEARGVIYSHGTEEGFWKSRKRKVFRLKRWID